MNASSTELIRKIRRTAGRTRSHAARGIGMRSRGVQNAAEKGRTEDEKFGKHQAAFESLVTLEISQNRQAFFGKAWSKTRDFWRSLEKGLEGAFIPPPLAPSHQRPPIKRDRHCEERSDEATRGSVPRSLCFAALARL